MQRLRKHPDAIALVFLGFVMLAGFGIRSAVRHAVSAERQFRVRELVNREIRHADLAPARDGILVFKDVLRRLSQHP